MSIDDLYNNFKIVEQEVKRTVTSSSNLNSSSQNMAFVSSPNSTNEVNTANVQVSTANSAVSTTDTPDSTANLSDATVYVFLANQPNGSQLVHEDLEKIHEDDLEEMDLKWQLALLSMRARRYFQRTGKKITINRSDTAGYDNSKVECFNCHKMRHFARECRGPRNQDNRNRNQDNSRRTMNVEETFSKAMVAIDGAGFDWSFMADEEVPTNMAFMAFSDSEKFASVEEQLVFYKKNEVMFCDQIAVLKKDTSFKDSEINALKTYLHPPTIDLSNSDLEEFQQPEFKGYGPKALTAITIKRKGWNTTPRAVLMKIGPKSLNIGRPVNTAHNNAHPKTIGHSQKEDQGYVDSGCSRHITGNMSYLSEFKEFDRGYVTFGGGAKGGRITGK
ncbi:ribonuclease H-like domain-containing protein [Tanacetum coccineum]